MSIHAYASMSCGHALEPFEYDERPLGPHDIEIDITHCGICHSDLHLIDNDWGVSTYPLVPGHEIIGTVRATGPEVRGLQSGQRVGVGWQRGACLECDPCVRGDEPFCAESQATCVGHFGGYADRIRVDGRFAFPIPEALDSENAAPLLCGGATVYSPLHHYGVRPHMRVGVIGIGGLGHLALQFARAFGCEVTAFSSSPDKADEAARFGAHHFVSSRSGEALAEVAGRFDFILSTVDAGGIDWPGYLQALRPNGRLCLVGVPAQPLSIPAGMLLARKSVSGSMIAGRGTLREMLGFAARHRIVAQTETFPMREVNTALDRLRANEARYRIVLTA